MPHVAGHLQLMYTSAYLRMCKYKYLRCNSVDVKHSRVLIQI